eukprot:CAMPEP_0175150934 /NCGR_PEP_ID=MMETSP0087-20121206/18180_1 /TAXON_ID=136419 /ORGANISM="Unknown Unknown, Strain D1" /LENGTH=320 /DNA_ID=CAMNT_0016437003 /DNA_START=149 /DNA_END=1112 /DNA_ORIENTATION=+
MAEAKDDFHVQKFTTSLVAYILITSKDWELVNKVVPLAARVSLHFLRAFHYSLEEQREKQSEIGLPLLDSPYCLIKVISTKSHPKSLRSQALSCLSTNVHAALNVASLLNKNSKAADQSVTAEQQKRAPIQVLDGKFFVSFFESGGLLSLASFLVDKDSCDAQDCVQVTAIYSLITDATRHADNKQAGVFVMLAVDAFQDTLRPLLGMKLEQMVTHQNPLVDRFANFFNSNALKTSMYAHVLTRFSMQALALLHQQDKQRFRTTVLVGRLVQWAFEIGPEKMFSTLKTVGFHAFLQTVEPAVTSHEALYKALCDAGYTHF